MFETAVVRARAADRRLLSLSVIAHTTIVAAVVAASLASTRLPEEAPKQMMPVVWTTPLPVLTPPAPPKPAAAPPKGHPAAAQTAPAAIPQVIPQVIPAATGPAALTPSTATVPSGPVGVETGKENSTGTDPNAPAAQVDGPVTAGMPGVTSPIVIHRVEPAYPPAMLRARMSGWVVLQCIIDKTGHIRDVSVVHSSFAAFEKPAIDAVQRWVFSPGTLRGQPVDVIFELTVKFEVR